MYSISLYLIMYWYYFLVGVAVLLFYSNEIISARPPATANISYAIAF